MNSNIYVFCVKQFWNTVAIKQVNDVTRLQALVDKKKVVVAEAAIREVLRLDDAEGVDCLPNEEIFTELAKIGYEKPSTKLTFYKAFFSSQWYFLIHTILQCMSAKQTSWNEFSSSMACVVICLSTGRKFNFSKPLFEGMLVKQEIEEERDADEHVEDVTVGDDAHGDNTAAHGEVPTVTQEPSIPSPTPTITPSQPPQHLPLTSRVQQTPPQSPQALEITKLKRRVKKLEKGNKAKVLKLRSLQKVGTSQRVDTSDDTMMEDESNQGRVIIEIDKDDVVVLMDKEEEDKKVEEAKENESETAEVQEVVDVVTTAKLITEVVIATSATIPTAEDPKEESTTSEIIPAETKSKDKGKWILVQEPKPLKKKQTIKMDEAYARKLHVELNKYIDWDVAIEHVKLKAKDDLAIKRYQAIKRKPRTEAQARKNMMMYLKNVVGFKLDYFKGMSYDDIRPIFEAKFNSNVDFLLKTKEQMEEEENRALQTINETPTEKAAKRRKLNKEVEDLKRHLEIVLDEDDDVYTEGTPLARKVPVVDYEIIKLNNKPYYKIIRADGTHYKLMLLSQINAAKDSLSPQVVSAAKLSILNPNEFDLWKMRIEQYFLMTDYLLWEVILNGDSPVPTRIVEGILQPVAPTTAEQKLARKNELKARGTLLMDLPDKHRLKFNSYKDVKTLMEAINKIFGGNTETKKVQKTLEAARNKADLEEQSLDDLFNSLKIYKTEVKQSSSTVSVAVSIFDVYAKMHVSSLPNVDSLSNAVIYSLFVSQSTSPRLDNKDLKQIDVDDLEEMDLRWQMAMLTTRKGHFARKCRSPKDSRRNGIAEPQRRIVPVETSTSNALVSQCDGVGSYDWSYQAEEEPANFALMAFSSLSFSSDTDLSPTKPAQDLSYTNRPTASIIEDWVSDSKDESETKAPQIVPSFVQSSKQVKSPRHSIQPVETSIPVDTPKPSSPKSNSSGNRRNRKTCFVCKSMDHLIKDCDYHAKKMAQTTPKNYAHRGNHKQYASLTHTNPQKHMVPAAVLTQSKLVSIIAVRPLVSAVVPKIKGNPQYALKDKGVIDSGCSRHMTGNMSYLFDFEELNGGYVTFGGNPNGGKISGKGKIKTGKLDFDDVYFVKELKFNLFSVSQMCDKKNSVLFTDTECLVLSLDFKLPDESQVMLRVPRENNMYNVNLKNIVPSGNLTCLFAKETINESNLWHRRLTHINFKTINKLVKGNLVRGLPTKVFKNDNTCVACKKGRQHRAFCKTKHVSSVDQPLFRLHMDLFGPTFVKSLNKKSYCLVVTDDYSRSDNETEFKNNDLNQFCGVKGIKKEFSVPRTLQQNDIAERKNMTLIEAARTMLADSLLPISFWAEAVNTACYVQNRVLVTKPHNKTPYELLHGRTPSISFMRPFGCPVTILNTLDSLGEEVDQQYMLYPVWSFGSTNPQNYDGDAAFDGKEHDFDAKKLESEVILSPSSSAQSRKQDDKTKKEAKGKSHVESFIRYKDLSAEFEDCSDNSSNEVNAAGTIVPTVGQNSPNSTNTFSAAGPSNAVASPTYGKSLFIDASQLSNDPDIPELKDITYSHDEDDVGVEADLSNLETSITVSPILTTRVHKDHLVSQIIGDLFSTTQTRSMTRVDKDQGGLSQMFNDDFHTCMFACFLSHEEPKRVHQAFKDSSWIKAMQEELLQFKMQKVWVLVDLPYGKRAIGTKWVFKNKNDERGIVVRNKARLVAQGHTQEEGIDYEEVFAPVARIEAIRLFLAYASFMGFMVYQMNVKSEFLYEIIEKEVYVCQPPGFEDPDHPDKVYKVVKALYGLHQAPRAWYETLANYLLDNGFQRGKIDQTLFIKKQKGDILLVQIYVDDIIFGATNKDLCKSFEKLMKDKFQMSSIGELTFFLGIQVKQKKDGIFISQDKYVAEILRKFGLT
nr:hypothetical protein [Tanacetum cinerariifolium]